MAAGWQGDLLRWSGPEADGRGGYGQGRQCGTGRWGARYLGLISHRGRSAVRFRPMGSAFWSLFNRRRNQEPPLTLVETMATKK